MARGGRGGRRRRRPRGARAVLRRFGVIELSILVPLMLIALGIWAFAELGDEIREGSTDAFDEAVLAALRQPGDPTEPIGGPLVQSAMRDLTSLGSLVILSLFAASCLGYLLLRGKRRLAAYMLVAIAGGTALSFGLKTLFGRPRPEYAGHFEAIAGLSFPSGHAFMSTVVYLTAGALLAAAQPQRWARIYVLALGTMLSVVVGFTRVYLGVHWATDVAAGWAAGAAWALICWLVARLLQQKGEIEPARDGDGAGSAGETGP